MAPLMVPLYQDLPIQASAPLGSACGVFDKDGKRDVYGTLNFITPEAVLAAKKELQTGESVVLNLPMHLPYHSDRIERQVFEHKVISKAYGLYGCDDELKLNIQSSSQCDDLLYYNGVKYADAAELRADLTLGIQSLSSRGGIVGRGVLLDFVYAAKHGIEYDVLTNYPISFTQIKEIIVDEGLSLKQGDILIVRTGLSKYIRNSSPTDKGPFDIQTHIGVDPTSELLQWIWNQNIAAVAGDAIAFEAIPAADGSCRKPSPPPFPRITLKASDAEICPSLPPSRGPLPGWAMPIGKLFDLEALAEMAEKDKRWSFFLTVCPLNVEGGAAALANTLAIF